MFSSIWVYQNMCDCECWCKGLDSALIFEKLETILPLSSEVPYLQNCQRCSFCSSRKIPPSKQIIELLWSIFFHWTKLPISVKELESSSYWFQESYGSITELFAFLQTLITSFGCKKTTNTRFIYISFTSYFNRFQHREAIRFTISIFLTRTSIFSLSLYDSVTFSFSLKRQCPIQITFFISTW